jgi:phosphoglycerate dehydrogenase-like enzyme
LARHNLKRRIILDILLLESLIPEAMAWLEARHDVSYQPQLALDERALHHSTGHVRAMVVPNHVVVNQDFLDFAPELEIIARLQIGTDNIDLESCRDRGIKVLQARSANVRANAEFLIGALLMLYRPSLVESMGNKGSTSKVKPPPKRQALLGREINGSTIGLLGIGPAATTLASLLTSMGARLIGYDPALHHSSPIWQQMRVQPVSLLDLMNTADAVSVQMLYASRFKGFVNHRVLTACKPGQVWVSISRGALFDAAAMLEAMQDGRIAAWMSDSSDDMLGPEMPLLRTLPNFFTTQRVGSLTRESHQRASWYMAHRLHDILSPDGEAAHSSSMALPGDNAPPSWVDSNLLSPEVRAADAAAVQNLPSL